MMWHVGFQGTVKYKANAKVRQGHGLVPGFSSRKETMVIRKNSQMSYYLPWFFLLLTTHFEKYCT